MAFVDRAIYLHCAYAALMAIALRAEAQSQAETRRESSAPVATESFEAPHPKHGNPANFYPVTEIQDEGEGWVALSFMVDAKGKPYEIAVTDSTGNKTFEHAAVRAVGDLTFEPGLLNGRPVESAFQTNVRFVLYGIKRGANEDFIGYFKSATAAIDAKDRALADAAMKHLVIRNLTEDAYYGLLKFEYARVWGNDMQQLAGLRRAVADEAARERLRKPLYVNALRAYLVLELKIHDYAAALKTWGRLQKLRDNADANMQSVIEDLGKLRTDDRKYDVVGELSDELWNLDLFKRHFRITVDNGYIAQVKLLCTKRYVTFAFEPQAQYSADEAWGDCSLRLEGTPGTHFALSQS